jgi:DNA ligase-1
MLWKPTLAATLPNDVSLDGLPYPLWASPKVDGIRVMIQNGVAVSRNGRPIPNRELQAMLGHKRLEGLDGEVTEGPAYGPDVFNRSARLCSAVDAALGEARYHVFDYYAKGNWMDRLLAAEKRGCFSDPRRVLLLSQVLVNNSEELIQYEQSCLEQGYEGVMLRNNSPYLQKPGKGNRSTLREFVLVKLKRFEHGTAVILQAHPLEHNTNIIRLVSGRRSTNKAGIVKDKTRIGSVLVKDTKTKVQFALKVPTDEAQLWPGWQNGDWFKKRVRYRYFPTGNVKAPRFPTADFKELL